MMVEEARLRAALEEMDQEADAVVAQAFQNDSVDELNEILKTFVATRDIRELDNPPQVLTDYINDLQNHLDTFDQDRIRNGQDLFNINVGICAAALTIASLPEAYAMKTSGAILARTQRLEGAAAFKRVAETSQFVLRIMTDRGLECFCEDQSAAIGTGAILRVRLMHAAIRRLVNKRQQGQLRALQQDYSTNDWEGKPINQIELLFTLLCFSWVTLRAIRQAYQTVTEQQAEDYVYLWSCVGKLMGIDAVLIPTTVTESEEMFKRLKGYGIGHSDEGEELTQSAIKVMEKMLIKKAFVPNWIAPSVTLILMSVFVDQETRDLLRVRKLNLLEVFLIKPAVLYGFKCLATVYGLFSSRRANDLKAELGYQMLEYFANFPEEVGVADFIIPESLGGRLTLVARAAD